MDMVGQGGLSGGGGHYVGERKNSERGVSGAIARQGTYPSNPGRPVRVRTKNQVTGLSTSTAIKPDFGAERYLYGVQVSEIACRKIFFFPRSLRGS